MLGVTVTRWLHSSKGGQAGQDAFGGVLGHRAFP